MTISAWIGFGIIAVCTIGTGICGSFLFDKTAAKITSIITALILVIGIFFGARWYYQNTASGQRALIDQRSDIGNGLERTITIYTADGAVIAQYSGKIDIEGNDGGYVLFDYDGKRYTYYNCFIESIAKID